MALSVTDAKTEAAARLTLRKDILKSLVCPDCRKPLKGENNALICPQCESRFEVNGGVPKLWPPSRAAALEASVAGFRGAHADVRGNPILRALLQPNPNCDPGRAQREAQVNAAMSGGLVLNLGCKSARWGEHVVNLDLVAPQGDGENTAGGVDVLGDIARLPFADGSVDGVICTYVLEHVADARECIAEIARVIRPGGHVYVTVPFLFPTHPDPLDRWRFTLDGLRHSMNAFEEISAGTCGGPFSAYVSIVPTLTASFFSNFYLFNIVRATLGWLLWPVKFLDYIAWRSKKAYMAPANFYFLGKKK